MTIVLECEFPSFFSYRIPGFSSQYALSSLFPGPSTVKLGLVATTIDYKGIEKAKEIFNILKNARIGIIPPKKIVTINVLIKRLKAVKEFRNKVLPKNLKALEEGKIDFFNTFEKTYGIRGYVQYSEPLKIVIENLENEEQIEEIAEKLGRLGSYDSVVFCRKGKIKDNSEVIWAKDKLLDIDDKNYFIIPIKDLKSEVSFNDINPFYPKNKARKKVMKNVYYFVPIKRKLNGKNWNVYIIW